MAKQVEVKVFETYPRELGRDEYEHLLAEINARGYEVFDAEHALGGAGCSILFLGDTGFVQVAGRLDFEAFENAKEPSYVMMMNRPKKTA